MAKQPQSHNNSQVSISGPLPLAATRQRKGLTLQQIADETKIGVRTLEAIEKGDFGKLPGGVYSTSYLRQYARLVDVDEERLLEHYYEKTGAARPDADTSQPSSSSERKTVLRFFRLPSAVTGS